MIYGDTDSVFVWIQDARDDAAGEAAGQRTAADLNAWWSRMFARNFNSKVCWKWSSKPTTSASLMPTIRGSDKGSKKRYAGVVAGKDGDRLVFKGLENVRTDWTRLARRIPGRTLSTDFYAGTLSRTM